MWSPRATEAHKNVYIAKKKKLNKKIHNTISWIFSTSASPLLGSFFLSALPLAMLIGIASRRMHTCGTAYGASRDLRKFWIALTLGSCRWQRLLPLETFPSATYVTVGNVCRRRQRFVTVEKRLLLRLSTLIPLRIAKKETTHARRKNRKNKTGYPGVGGGEKKSTKQQTKTRHTQKIRRSILSATHRWTSKKKIKKIKK